MKNVFIALLVLFHADFAAAQSVVPAGQGEEAMVGKGYNPDTQAFQGRCLKGRAEEYGQPIANIDFSQSISQSELANSLGFGAGGKFRYGVAKVGASAKFFRQQQSSAFSISSVYSGEYRFRNLVLNFEDANAKNGGSGDVQGRLSDVGRTVYGNDQKWLESCGTEYVEQIERGAKLFYSIRIDFSSTEEKEVFEAAFSYESSFASVHAYLKNSSRRFSRNTKVTIGALQIGGDVSKITELFNAENDATSALGFVQCSFGDFSKCDRVMETAWNYATKEFKKQLATDPNTPPTSGGPAYLTYRTKKYAAAGIHGQLLSVVNLAIQRARKQLERFFDKQLDILGETRHLLQGKTVVLSPRQRRAITEVDQTAASNLEKLVAAARLCYDQPADCIEAVNQMTDPDEGIKEIDPTRLVVQPETFLQFCNLAQTPVAPERLKASIRGLIDGAKDMDPSSFHADAGGRTDECLITHMVFSQRNSLSLARKGIITLEPLAEYTHLVTLDLSNNSIEDVSPLKGFHNVTDLNLHGNRIRAIESLSGLRSLERLRVSNNSLRDISDLRTAPSLVRVDARNNFPTVTCGELKQIQVCLSASARTDSNFIPVPTRSSVPFFMPSLARLSDGRILAVGLGEFAQIFEPRTNSFSSTGGIGLKSFAHVSAALNDGRIMVTGGWGSLKRIALYQPQQAAFTILDNGLKVPRANHQVTVLRDGRVLITGGWEGGSVWTGANASYTAEIFDPATNATRILSHMHAPRAAHTATLLNDGRVLLTGGFSHQGSLATAEIFDPETERFSVLRNSMSDGRGSHSATLLDDGSVLIAGGFERADHALSSAEIFDPKTNSFRRLPEPLNKARGAHSALKLRNGKVLLSGGSDSIYSPAEPLPSSNVFITTGELFDPAEGSMTEIPSQMTIGRSNHAMVEIADGMVLIIGGLSWDAAHHSEVFTYTDIAETAPRR